MTVPPPPRRARSGALTVLMFLVGILLLLPGLCAGAFVVAFAVDPQGLFNNAELLWLWATCFAVAAGGSALIRYAVRR
jgi:hypothetical protein